MYEKNKGGTKTEKHIYTKNYMLSFYFCYWGQKKKNYETISFSRGYLGHFLIRSASDFCISVA